MPAKIDRYDLLRKLATGGMAEIFLAKQSGLEGFEKVVVIKRILRHLAADEEFVSMFLDEARIAAKLSHPNIVQIYDLGKADDSYYIAMEYVSGRNVQHIMNKAADADGMIPVEHVCRIMAGVCDGLYYAHSRKDYDGKPLNIVHRDISPQNILVSFAGGVKVVDFGIAKASTQLAQTRAGVLKGKYAYMSPEQVRGQKVDHRSDVFSVGLVMYEALTGRRAFERESSLKTLKAIVQEKPLNPRELNPEVPMEVVKLLSKALEKNPDRRYANAQEMQLAIEDYLESSPKKSNNVRLSRYLYEVFDDELNADGGTMVVQGIGEVIIPTGAPSDADQEPADAVEEEVDEHTLSAALADIMPPGHDDEDDETRTNMELGVSPAGASTQGIKRDLSVIDDDDDEPLFSGEGDAEDDFPPTEALPADAQQTAAELGLNPEDLEPDEYEDDEPDDATIPAFDVSDYQRNLARQEAEEQGFDPSMEEPEDHTAALDAADVARLAKHGSLSSSTAEHFSVDSDDATQTVDADRAKQLLEKVDAIEKGANQEWEAPTQQREPAAESVTAAHDDQPLAVRPAMGAIRPAAAGGGAQQEPTPLPQPSPPPPARPPSQPHQQSLPPPQPYPAPQQPQPPPTLNPAIAEATPTTARQPRAEPPAGMPKYVWLLLGGMGLCLVLSVVLVVVVLVASPNPAVGFRQVTLTAGAGEQIEYNGAVYGSPANVFVPPGTLTVVVIKDGQRREQELEVPPGAVPIVLAIPGG
jgi:serine/threonine protein kinase